MPRVRWSTVIWACFGLLVVGAVVVLTLIVEPSSHATMPAMMPRRPAPSAPPSVDLATLLLTWWSWIVAVLLAPVFVWIGQTLSNRSIPIRAVVWGGTILLATSLSIVSWSVFTEAWIGVRPPSFGLGRPVVRVLLELAPFVVIGLAVLFVQAETRAERTRLEAEVLRGRVAEGRLQALTAQLQPHFLFNTLQAVSTLLHRDVQAADRMVGGLAELLRGALEGTREPIVPLSREVELLQTYLGIMEERLGPKVQVMVQVPPDVQGSMVPVLILQPLLENAFEHAVDPTGVLHVTVRAERRGGRLILSVQDDGPGVAPGATPGVGLGNTRERLHSVYGATGALEVVSAPGQGTTVRLQVPERPRG